MNLEKLLLGSRYESRLNIIKAHSEILFKRDVPIHIFCTLHGIDHSNSIISKLNSLIDGVDQNSMLTIPEIFCLLSSVYLHDVGMLITYPDDEIRAEEIGLKKGAYTKEDLIRDEHHLRSGRYIIDHRIDLKLDQVESVCIKLICEGYRITNLNSSDFNDKFVNDECIRIRFLAALLRLADELDISYHRVPEELMDLLVGDMPEFSQLQWLKHYYTTGVRISSYVIDGNRRRTIIEIQTHYPNLDTGTKITEELIFKPIEKTLRTVDRILLEYGLNITLNKPKVILNEALDVIPSKICSKYLCQEFKHSIQTFQTSPVKKEDLQKKVRNTEQWKTLISSSVEARTKSNLPRVVIFTALPVEYNAVRDHLENLEEKVHPQGTIYERGIFSSNDQEWDVGIAEIGQGNEQAALEVERAIQYFNPSIAFFVGVAGGVKDVQLGDVVVASKVYGYESGKAGENFDPRPEAFTPDYKLVNRARAEARKDDWLLRLGALVPNSHPNVFVKPIAAGAKVLSSTRSEAYNLIKFFYGDTLAVEMEGYGFLRAAHANSHVCAMVIRGVSDLIDRKDKADKAGFQEIASRHASAFAFEVLAKSHIEPVDSIQKSAETSDNPKVFTSSSTGMQLVLIPAGKFMMGSDIFSRGKPVHEVTIKESFYMGKYPVTQKQWIAIMGSNPSKDNSRSSFPVVSVSWNDVQEFIKRLNDKESTNKYRLPSEAEWEYTCRAGKQTKYCFGDNESKLEDYAWYIRNSGGMIHQVGQKKPNSWDLYDMHGHVWEWVQDGFHFDYVDAPLDGSAWEGEDSSHIRRGASFMDGDYSCQSAYYDSATADYKSDIMGFRLVREL